MGTSESKYTDLQDEKETSKIQAAALVETNYEESDGEYDQLCTNNLKNDVNNNTKLNIIRFNEVCGKNIILSSNNLNAKRVERSFCDAIVFSNRPVNVYERVYVKITSLSSVWNGMLRLGLTSVNPDTHRKCYLNCKKKDDDDDYLFDLPKYVYPDLTNRKGYWAGAVPQNLVRENDVLYFYFNQVGEIHYGVNGVYKGQFLDGVEVNSKPLWAVFDIYGNTLSIELISNDSSQSDISLDTISSISNNFRTFNSVSDSGSSSIDSSLSSVNMVTIVQNDQVNLRKNRQNRRSVAENFDRLLISHRRLCVDNHLNETLRDSFVDNSEVQLLNEMGETVKIFYESIPILIHEKCDPKESYKFISKIHGKNVNIFEPDCLIAYRESSINQFKNFNSNKICKEPTRNAYVFLDKPVSIGKSFCLQIVGIDQSFNESKLSLGIGCTTCNPNQLNPRNDLPDDADCLLDRREYWIVFQNLFNSDLVSKKHNVSLADELCFLIDEQTGNLKFYINGNLITNCLFNLDVTQKLWFFFDLCGRINAVRLIQPCEKWNQTPKVERLRPNSALIDYFKSQLIPDDLVVANQKNSQKDSKKRNSSVEECRICLDAPIECVFYSCGHMCLCWNCASALKKQSSSSQLNSSKIQQKKNPLCPICRVEIIDIIRFFKS